MKILGLGGSNHDYAYCYLEDGKISCAIEEERLSREKHSQGPKSQVASGISYCLDKVPLEEMDLIIANDILSDSVMAGYDKLNIVRINHHLAHAASSYYTSGLEEASILVLDGGGSQYLRATESCSLGYAQGTQINFTDKYYGNSLANFYLFMTFLNRFGFLQEGKVMGLAPYGKDTYVKILSEYIDVEMPKRNNVSILSDKLLDLMDFEIFRSDKRDLMSIRADIAYATQVIFENNVFKIMRFLYEKTRCKNLCYAGGAALNSVLNGKIAQNTEFEKIFVFPGAGDAGTSVGAALYGYHNIYKNKVCREPINHVFWGRSYTNDEVYSVLNLFCSIVDYREYTYPVLYKITAQKLAEGKIVGWFQDGAEFGPRALGNRSILADARSSLMKDYINQKIKFREDFRPFAPVVLKEKVNQIFDCSTENNPFMLFVEQVKDEYRDKIPAVTHVDGSARVQTVTQKNNEKLYSLLVEFEAVTGLPVLLNTSFNIKGQPIVETPKNALDDFINSDLDVLIMNTIMVTKR